MARPRLSVGVILETVPEEGGLRADASQPAGEVTAEPIEVIGAHLIHRDEHDELWPPGLRVAPFGGLCDHRLRGERRTCST